MKLGNCFICGNECSVKNYCHEHCAVAYGDALRGRLKAIWNKYGTNVLGAEQCLIHDKDLK